MTTLQSLDADLQEVHRLVNLTKSALVRDRLHGLLSELLQRKRQMVMDGPGSVGPDMLPYSAAGPSSRSGSYVGPPASAPFGGLSHPLGGAGMVGGTQGSGEVPNNGDFAMTLASPGSGPGVVIRSASRSDSGQSNGHTPQHSGVLGSTASAPNFSTALSDGHASGGGGGGAGGPDLTGLAPYDPMWSGPQQQQQQGPSTSNGFPPGGRSLPGPGRLPVSAGFDPGALEFGLLDLQQQQQREQLQQQQHQEQQLAGQQQQLPLAEYHGAGGGGMMDPGQLAMHGLPMYRQQPPQPPRMRRGGMPNYLAGRGVPVDYGAMPMRPPPPPPPPALPGLHGMLPGGSAGPLMPLHGLPRLTGLPPNGYGGMMMPTQDAPQHGNSAFPALQYGIDLPQFGAADMNVPTFRTLTTYSWEQSDMLVKIYVPLRGVQTDLLRATFMHMGLEVKVIGLQGRSYVFVIKTLYKPINADACHVAASKTKKNILITLQKLHWDTADEKHWKDLSLPGT